MPYVNTLYKIDIDKGNYV